MLKSWMLHLEKLNFYCLSSYIVHTVSAVRILLSVCSEWEAKRREWILHEAELFAHELLRKWSLGHCTEDVIVLYSLDDGVVCCSSLKSSIYETLLITLLVQALFSTSF